MKNKTRLLIVILALSIFVVPVVTRSSAKHNGKGTAARPHVKQIGAKHNGHRTAAQDEEEPPDYIGLWEAVDPDDDGHQILSVTYDEEGNYRLLLRDTYYTLCNGTANGVSRGTAYIDDYGILVSDDFTLQCIDIEETRETPTSFYYLNPEGTLLFRDRAEPLTDITYHRTSF